VHAFIDESKRGDYILCAVTIAPGDVADLRKRMESLRPRGATRIHMKSCGREAGKIVTEVAKLDVSSRLYVLKPAKLTERQARDVTLEVAVRDLAEQPVSRLIIESCDQDQEDRRVIHQTLGPQHLLEYQHERPTNPLLWLPDVHAWAWGRGGAMRSKIEHKIEVVRL
jgi:hypothetical protein